MNIVSVRFTRAYGPYNGGDVAGFPEHKAKALCSGSNPVAELTSKVQTKKGVTAPVVDKRLKGPDEEKTSSTFPKKIDTEVSTVVTKTSKGDTTPSEKK